MNKKDILETKIRTMVREELESSVITESDSAQFKKLTKDFVNSVKTTVGLMDNINNLAQSTRALDDNAKAGLLRLVSNQIEREINGKLKQLKKELK